MVDITPQLNVCLSQHGIQPVVEKEFDISRLNTFLQEAYSIVYLS